MHLVSSGWMDHKFFFLIILSLIFTGCIIEPEPTRSLNYTLFQVIEEGYGCHAPVICGEIVEVDCDSALDGPTYYFNKYTGERVSTCGGACWNPQGEQIGVCKTLCPPAEWNCDSPIQIDGLPKNGVVPAVMHIGSKTVHCYESPPRTCKDGNEGDCVNVPPVMCPTIIYKNTTTECSDAALSRINREFFTIDGIQFDNVTILRCENGWGFFQFEAMASKGIMAGYGGNMKWTYIHYLTAGMAASGADQLKDQCILNNGFLSHQSIRLTGRNNQESFPSCEWQDLDFSP
jgi:hypothetical protein